MTVTPRISSCSWEGRRWWAGAGAAKSKAFIPAGTGPTIMSVHYTRGRLGTDSVAKRKEGDATYPYNYLTPGHTLHSSLNQRISTSTPDLSESAWRPSFIG